MSTVIKDYAFEGNKVCILSSAHNALDHRVFYKEARSLAKAGLDVTLIASHEKEEVKDGVRIIPLKTKGGKFTRFSSGMWEIYFLALKEKADVYHFHDPDLLIVGLLLKLKTRSKVIYDVHEFYSKSIKDKDWIPFKSIRNFASSLYSFMERNVTRFYDGVIVVVDKQKDLFYKDLPSEILYNYPLIDFSDNNCQTERKGNQMVHIGTLTEVRGIYFLMEALNYVVEKKPDTVLILGGNFHSKNFKKKVFDYVEENNLKNNVKYVGYVPFKEVNDYLKKADIGVVPVMTTKKNLGLPTKLFEFMQSQLPIVYKDFPHNRDYIIANNCGLLVQGDDPKNFAEAIIKLLEDDEMRKKMGENGHSAFIKYYNWGIEEKKLIKFYQMILKNN